MRSLPTPALPSVGSHQLSIPFHPGRLCGMSASERRAVLARLTRLMLEAAGVASEERDDDER